MINTHTNNKGWFRALIYNLLSIGMVLAVSSCTVTFKEAPSLKNYKHFSQGRGTYLFDFESPEQVNHHKTYYNNPLAAKNGKGLLYFRRTTEYGHGFDFRTDTILSEPINFIFVAVD
jgi:hypothetical protein